MPRLSKRAIQSRQASEIALLKRQNVLRNKKIHEIHESLKLMDSETLELAHLIISELINNGTLEIAHQTITNSSKNESSQRSNRCDLLVKSLEKLTEDQLKAADHLFQSMRYPKGQNQGQIISPFVQKKAIDIIGNSLYKTGQSSSSLIQQNKILKKQVAKLEKSNAKKLVKDRKLTGTVSQYKCKHRQYISKVRATACKKPLFTNSQTLKESIKAMIMKNKSQYTTEFINVTTQISQIGQMSFQSTVQATQMI